MKRFLFLLGWALAAGNLGAEPVPAPWFYASFDHGTTADQAAGSASGSMMNAKGQTPADVALTAGLCGKALVTGAVSVQYATARNMAADAGTVSLWVNGLTWAPDDDKRHNFFGTDHVMAGKESISNYTLYKWEKYVLTAWSNVFMLHIDGGKMVEGKLQINHESVSLPHSATDDWEQGEWHFLAFTYDRKVGEAIVYADGVEVARARQTLPEQLGKFFYVGSRFEEEGCTAIDELRIWGQVLSAAQVKGVYLQDRKKAKGK